MIMTSRVLRTVAIAALAAFLIGCRSADERKARHVQAGDRLVSERKYSEAALEYRNALKIDARYGDARWKLAGALDASGRKPDAYREYLRAAELLPKRSDVQERAAAVYLGARNFAEARKHAEAALAVDPRNTVAQLLLANALANLNDVPAAIREIEEAIQITPLDSRSYTALGGLRLAEGNRKEAESAYRKAVELDPKSVLAKVAFAYFSWLTGSLREAEQQFQAAIALDAQHPLANRMLILFYLNTNRASDAEAPLLRLAEANDAPAMLTVADHYTRTGRQNEARPIYERLLSDKTLRTAAIGRLAQLDYTAHNGEAAHRRLDEELSAHPNNVQLLAIKADLFIRDRRWSDAEAVATKAVAAGRDSAQAHFTLGLAQTALRKTDLAIASFNETVKLNPRAAAAQVQLAALRLASGSTDEALRHAAAARRLEPGNVAARVTEASALLVKRDLGAADREISALLKDLPEEAAVQALAGKLAAARHDSAGAVRAFDRALVLDRGNVDALAGRMTVDLQLKRPDAARKRLSDALAANDKDPQVRLLAARFENTVGDSAAAERHLRAAIELDAAFLEAYAMLGRQYMRQNKLEEARVEFEQLAGRASNAVGAKTMVAVIYDIQGRAEESIKAYEAIVASTSRAPVAANNLAWRYAEKNEQLDRALELAQSAKAQLPEQAEVDDTIGWIYYKKNMPLAAIQPLENSVKRDPGNAMYHSHLGLAYAKAGRVDEAIRALQRALTLGNDFPGVKDVRTTLEDLKARSGEGTQSKVSGRDDFTK